MQKLKKPVSILLVFMMIVSLFAAVPMTVNAAPPGGGGITSKTITLYANNGTDQSYSQSNTVGMLNVTNPLAYGFTTPDNKTFSSWNTQPDGTGADYGSSFTYNFSSDLTLYAQWVTLYTVTWNNWDDTELDTDEVEEGATPTYDGATPTKDGVTFAGWTDSHGVFYEKDAVLPEVTADETYTAVFELTIGSVDEWNSFAASVKSGNTYSGVIVRMTADVGPVTTMVDGTFSGTFDGDGHTLTVNISGGSTSAATFAYVKDATIQNLRLEGTVTSSGIHTAALVKSVSGTGSTCTIKNVDIYADVNCSQGYIGGFIGHGGKSNTVNIENSIFAGNIKNTGSGAGYIGGFIGWSQIIKATINNCAFTGSYSNIQSFNNIGFSYNAPTKVTVNDFYSNVSEVFNTSVNNGTRLYVPSSSYPTTVALVKNNDGETFYSAFSDALAAWTDGSTLALLADVTCDSQITVPAADTKTLDLNGNALSLSYSSTKVEVNGTLTIQSTASGGSITPTTKSRVINVVDGGTLNIESGTINGYNADRAVIGGVGTINLNGGKIVTPASNAFSPDGVATLNLNGGEIECTSGSTSMGTASAVWAHGDSTINWNGTAITTNTGDGIRMKSAGNGTVNVTGGSFTATSSSLPEEGGYAIYCNSNMGTLNLEGNPSFSGRGIYLTNDKVINITDDLSNTNPICVTMQTPGVFTSGLAENGDATNFANGNGTGYAITLNASGEAQIVSTYTVTWKDEDGTVLKTEDVAKGDTPSYGATPTKAEDENYTYTFAGWTPEVSAVTGDTEYTAQFTAVPKPKKLTLNVGENGKVVMDNGTFGNATDASNINEISAPFNVADGSKIFIVDGHSANLVEGGSINIATGGEVSFYPSADNTGEITAIPDEGYALYGWYDGDTLYSEDTVLAYQNIDKTTTLTAVFAPAHTVTWKDAGGTILRTDTIAEGKTPSYGSTPTKANDDYHSYNFSGWTDGTNTYGASDTLPAVTGDVTYTAKYTVFTKQFTVFVKTTTGKTITANGVSGDTTVAELKDMVVEESGIPAAEQRLIFAGKEMENEKTLADYNIQKESTLHVVGKSYTITWKNDDGSVIDTTTVEYGETPTHADPEKAATAQYNYTFLGWSPAVTAVTGNAEYTATFSSAVNDYTVTWKNGDDVLKTDTVAYGEIPVYTGSDPEKADDADYTYTFAGWAPEITAVTGDTTYTATFTATAKPKDLFPQHSITLGGNIGVNFYIDSAAADFANASTAVVKFTWDNGNYHEEVDLKALTPDTSTGYYKATVDVVAAHMAHEIHAEVYLDGEKLDQTDDYSVKEYAETVYANPAEYDSAKPNELKSLVLSLLNYGAMAQTVFDSALNEKPALANATVGDNGYEYVTADMIAAAINGTASDLNAIAEQLGAKYYTNSLIYLSKNTLRIYFTPTSYPGEIPNAGAYDGNLSGYYYYVDHADIPAAELDNQQTFNVNGTEFTFSALDYAKAVVESTKMEPEQQNLAKSLYLYNMTANDYFDAAPAPAQNIVDLSTLEGDYEAQNNDVLIGILSGDKIITIADGATVTLKDVTITCLSEDAEFAGITPLGDATILLEGENTVKGGYEDFPGVFVPVGKTLTIDGTGSLNASSNGYGCGIGGGYDIEAGNIVINGGTITATGGKNAAGIGSGNSVSGGNITITGGTITANGGDDAAGIGSGSDSTCGNILITGGTVTANGRYSAAGIGSGYEATCGNITIADTVTQVTATKGNYSPNSIGAGDEGSCGTVTIAPGANVIQN